jgi:hypothetical protein
MIEVEELFWMLQRWQGGTQWQPIGTLVLSNSKENELIAFEQLVTYKFATKPPPKQ